MNILVFSKQTIKNSRFKKSTNNSFRNGFLLIELMVSITLFLFFIYLMHSYLFMTEQTSHDALDRYAALAFVESFIADLKHNPSLLKQKKYDSNGYTLTWNQQPFPLQQTGFLKSMISHCQAITFNVSWRGKDKKPKTISITTGIVV